MASTKSVPVTMLSGFLGAGKTSLLRYVLQSSGLKVACIVNDVAAVNIDAKLIRGDAARDPNSTTADLTDTIELANGCACCSIADELMASFANLLELSDKRGTSYDRIILENSGVAEPQNIRDQFNDAIAEGHPLMQRCHLDTLITVVDSGTFINDYSSRAPLMSRPDLGEGGGLRPVVDLLVEQIEVADYIVLNKIDLLDTATVESLTAIMASLNPLAQVVSCEHGKIPADMLFGKDAQALVAHLNTEGQHRGAVAAAHSLRAEAAQEAEEGEEEAGHAHKREHHEHGHEHGHDGHEHKHDHAHGHHEHGHDHHDRGHKHDERGHDHGRKHGHKHDRQTTTAAKRFGITSFVYARRLPFHPQRLKDLVLKWMPVSHNKTLEQGQEPELGDSPIKTVLRSKGFMWVANSHTTAFYWSHAGQYFEIRDEGEWWSAVADDMWPEARPQRDVILADFDAEGEWGDRRQEIVFIGASMDEAAITAQLDSALLTEEEMSDYRANFDEPDPVHPDALKLAAVPKKAKH
uniref:CobW C-terminal domain-containing protein n=2 Tax=Auxenochlorella protothecoides TaxID=3075 RepID=A0A1D2AFQ4_AUXPR